MHTKQNILEREVSRFEGYAAVFDTEDLDGDVIVKGAFRNTLRARQPGEIKFLYQHDSHQPVGRWIDLAEDDIGLRVTGELLLEVERGRDCFELMRAGILDGLSIGFRTIKAADKHPGTGRFLYELELWEVSLVTFPMHPRARITSGRSKRVAGLARTIERATAIVSAAT